ncbi:MAG: hypothetical protein JW982_13610 [Spirochaetes bacterium]|nr:hypothetical protein [Spirochaetota bacterium]
MELVVFNDDESNLIFKCLAEVEKRNNSEAAERIKNNINALIELARAISQYPSILKKSNLFGEEQSAETLIEMLCQQEDIDQTMHIPTKAMLGKGFLVAKINFFRMIEFIASRTPELRDESVMIHEDITAIIFTIMSEDVFLSIIEDKKLPETIRNRAAFLLANIWEYRLNYNVKDFAPILNSIWEGRKKLIPVFGTLLGTSELMMMSFDIDKKWLEFLNDKSDDKEVFQALEEFLFTLTFEELENLRKKMTELRLTSVKKEEIQNITGKKQMYAEFNHSDTREMYRFFRDRKHNAHFRQRAEIPGPKKTIEEYIMCHILNSDEWQ